MAQNGSGAGSLGGNRSLAAFFLLVLLLSLPFWLIGTTAVQLLQGLPLSALAAVCPALAAVLLVWGSDGADGKLLARSFDAARIRPLWWFAPILLIAPGVQALAFLASWAMGTAIPAPQIAVVRALVLAVFFFVGAMSEELGWSGYALEPMIARFGSLGAALLLGAAWALWHLVPLLQAHRSMAWIAWWGLGTIAARVVMTALYLCAGRSVFAMALFHASVNLAWQIAPNLVAWYDPRLQGLVMSVVALILGAGLSRRHRQRPPPSAAMRRPLA